MTVGKSATDANAILTAFKGGTTYGYSTVYLKLHTGDPGAAGTANASAETTRKLLAWGSASGGSLTTSGTVSWASWSAGTETITHFSLWDSATAGTFIQSGSFTAPRTVYDTDTLNVTSITAALTPIAA